MIRLRWFLLGVVSLGAIALLAAAFVLLNAHGFSTREQPSAAEGWIARWAEMAARTNAQRQRLHEGVEDLIETVETVAMVDPRNPGG